MKVLMLVLIAVFYYSSFTVAIGYLQVASGPDSTCAIKEDKTIACWGDLMYTSPTSIPGGNANFTQIVSGGGASAGGSYMCALRQDSSA